ncbi:MAG: tetratricopeptide repeat protein [Candidatus Omnitrophica bacterium]|nr:tetratricopeptide repeat protein [Candidatus Omnitrophota bacterium]
MLKRISFIIALMTVFLLASHAITMADETRPDNVETFISLGLKFYAKMQYVEAKKYFIEAEKLQPKKTYQRFIKYALGVLDEYAVQLAEIESLNNRLRSAPDPDKPAIREKLKDSHLILGKQLLEKESYVAIVAPHFDYVISQDPLNLEARLYLGDINYSGMLYEEAIKNYKKVNEADPDNPFFRQRLGDIYAGVGIYDEARKCYSEAIRLFKRARLVDKKDRIEYLKRLMRKMPTALEDIQKLMDEGRYQEIVSLCKKRAAMNPADVTAITYMGIALEESGNWKQAEALYKTAIKRNPDYPTPYYYLGRIYLLKRKNTQAAIVEIEKFRAKAQELLEIDKNAKSVLIAALHTMVYIHHEILRDYRTAIKESKELLELAPDDQEAHYNLALSYAYLNKKSMAYAEFKKVIAINPDTKIGNLAKSAIEGLQRYSSMDTLPYHSEE